MTDKTDDQEIQEIQLRFRISKGVLFYDGPEQLEELGLSEAETLKLAWRITLAKWNVIRENFVEINEDGGITTCGLCMLYNCLLDGRGCVGCPVYACTGKAGCSGTYYTVYKGRVDGIGSMDMPNMPDFVANLIDVIDAEIAFLKKVRKGDFNG